MLTSDLHMHAFMPVCGMYTHPQKDKYITYRGEGKYSVIFPPFHMIISLLYILPWVGCLVVRPWQPEKLGEDGVEGLAGPLK